MRQSLTSLISTTKASPRRRATLRRRRRGSIVIYALAGMTAMAGVASLVVDWGHVQLVKTEAQRDADATARAYLEMYTVYGASIATSYAPYLASETYNPVDKNSNVAPTITITPGTWNTSTNTFTPGGTVGCVAVKVTISRRAGNGNGVPLFWAKILGRNTCDVNASATAAIVGGQSGAVALNATANPYIGGMPAGTTTGWGDNATNATPYQVISVPVVPGTYMSFSNLSGTTTIVPGSVPLSGPAGDAALPLHHGENWNGNPNVPGPENGIADAVMPADAFFGVFMNNTESDLNPTPATIDWTAGNTANQATYSSIVNQQPFLIGTGKTSGGTVKTFLVPPGATKLFLAVWDGVQYSNNSGNIAGTISVQSTIQMEQ